jgi:hypothetical protein
MADAVKVFFRANLPHFYRDFKSLSWVTPAQHMSKTENHHPPAASYFDC